VQISSYARASQDRVLVFDYSSVDLSIGYLTRRRAIATELKTEN
jgi:hypothetical protein